IPFSTLLQSIVKNENLGKVSGVIDTIMTASSLIASLLAVALTGYISISLILGIVATIVLIAGIGSLIIIKVKSLEKLAQNKEEEMKSKDAEKSLVIFDEKESQEIPIVVPSSN
ncbi:MAG: hypothetical protein ACW96U_13395, partial [Candidatus Heimdallarchaeaceae archaeon]